MAALQDALPPQPARQGAEVRPALGVHPGPRHLRAARRRLGPRPARPGRLRPGGQAPRAAAHRDEARDDVLAFTGFPREVWRQVWSSNPQERLSKEVRRRTGVAGIFPDRGSVIRLAGAVPAGQDDERAEARRCMGPEISSACRKAAGKNEGNGTGVTSDAELTIEAISA
jgi:hypothetical protein